MIEAKKFNGMDISMGRRQLRSPPWESSGRPNCLCWTFYEKKTKMDGKWNGWKMILSFWVSAYFQVRLLLVLGGVLFEWPFNQTNHCFSRGLLYQQFQGDELFGFNGRLLWLTGYLFICSFHLVNPKAKFGSLLSSISSSQGILKKIFTLAILRTWPFIRMVSEFPWPELKGWKAWPSN